MVHVLVISFKNKYYSKGLEGWIQKTLMLNIKYKSCYSGHHQQKKKKGTWVKFARCVLAEFQPAHG